MKSDAGAFLFRYRNVLGPIVFLAALLTARPFYPLGREDLELLLNLLGIVVMLLGEGLRVLTIGYQYIERGGRNRQVYASKLVSGGVFAHCRNPLYVGNIAIAVGFALVVNAWIFYATVLPFVLLSYMAIVAAEEAFLRKKFLGEYVDYCRRVNRWLPRWTGWRESVADMRFNWRRVLIKEYNTLFILLLAMALVILWCEYRIHGVDALPAASDAAIAALCWLAGYLAVRWLKKSGRVRE